MTEPSDLGPSALANWAAQLRHDANALAQARAEHERRVVTDRDQVITEGRIEVERRLSAERQALRAREQELEQTAQKLTQREKLVAAEEVRVEQIRSELVSALSPP